jgi:hypothetical protein
MAIEIEREPLFPLRLASREVKNLLFGRRGDRPIHPATWHRWAGHGCRGVRLETLQVGGARYTSLAAIQRFFEALSRAHDDGTPPPAGGVRSPAAARRGHREAVRTLGPIGGGA